MQKMSFSQAQFIRNNAGKYSQTKDNFLVKKKPQVYRRGRGHPSWPCSSWEANDLLIRSLGFDENVSSFLLQIMTSAYSIIILMSRSHIWREQTGPAEVEVRPPPNHFFAHQCGIYAQF